MEKHRRGKYVGRSTRRVDDADQLGALEEAFRDAYERAINSKSDDERTTRTGPVKHRFTVVAIEIEGTNPIGDYIVHMDDA